MCSMLVRVKIELLYLSLANLSTIREEGLKLRWELGSEAAVQRCSYEKVFWKYAANLQENTHAFKSTLLKSHFGMGVPL